MSKNRRFLNTFARRVSIVCMFALSTCAVPAMAEDCLPLRGSASDYTVTYHEPTGQYVFRSARMVANSGGFGCFTFEGDVWRIEGGRLVPKFALPGVVTVVQEDPRIARLKAIGIDVDRVLAGR